MTVINDGKCETGHNGRFALIIATSEYEDHDLRELISPAQDARTLATILKDQSIGNFDEVKVLLNEPSYKVDRDIQMFFTGRRRDDLLLSVL